jgi:hypothetical protein
VSEQPPVPAGDHTFERIKRTNERGAEFWSARELARVLEYSDFRNFVTVITKAREACSKSGHTVADHFVGITEMVGIGSGAQRGLEDWALSRHACYLAIQNADPAKPLVALGQTYFAVKGSVRQTTINESFGPICQRINKTTSVKGSRVLHFYISSSFLISDLSQLPVLKEEFDKVAEERSKQLVEAHERFSQFMDARQYQVVYPVLPMDILGIYVLLPDHAKA